MSPNSNFIVTLYSRCLTPHSSIYRAVRFISLLMLLFCYAPLSIGEHRSREDPVEPIFTERAFIENNIELDVEIENGFDSVDLELSAGISWIFWDRLQLGAEIPYGISIPDQEATRSNISDIGLSAKVLLCCDTDQGYTFVSLRSDVSIPSGSLAKDIGGQGSFGFSLLGGYGLTVVPSWNDLTVQIEIAYEQQIRLSNDQQALVNQTGMNDTREKEVDWNIAFAQQFAGGRINPVFEILGSSIVDALITEDQGTIVELSVGGWLVPFSDNHALSNFSIGMGWRWPVTERRNNNGVGMVIFELAFD